MTLTLTIDDAQIARVKAAIMGTASSLRKELAVACNTTARTTKSLLAKQISRELATSQKNIKTTIGISRNATTLDISATVEVRKSKRIPLKEFGARQTKVGVSYRISKSQGRKMRPGAFQGPRPGLMKASWKGNVFKRVGKSRLPIVKLHGPSPWGVIVVGDRLRVLGPRVERELKKQIDRRIRFLSLKSSGVI